MFSVHKSSWLVPKTPMSLFNCGMGNISGFPEIMYVSGNFYLSLLSVQFFETCDLLGER